MHSCSKPADGLALVAEGGGGLETEGRGRFTGKAKNRELKKRKAKEQSAGSSSKNEQPPRGLNSEGERESERNCPAFRSVEPCAHPKLDPTARFCSARRLSCRLPLLLPQNLQAVAIRTRRSTMRCTRASISVRCLRG